MSNLDKAYLQDRAENPDVRFLEGPRYAIVVDKGFQSTFVLGSGNTPEEAYAQARAYKPPEPRKPSYEELETSAQTREHIDQVRVFLREAAVELLRRGETHDQSKLDRAEVDTFTEYTGRLKGMTYGSDEYKQCLKDMAPALEHHYKHNRHHPEHYSEGIEGMNLIDLLEMFLDWKAAVRRHDDGDLAKSIEINRTRFKMEAVDLSKIFHNTMRDYGG